ncbi:MAG: hypothetical protein FJX75_06630 [Armatimonadetes bacterium]|nr:hypothetical protein [Armatimonadota bacterium]
MPAKRLKPRHHDPARPVGDSLDPTAAEPPDVDPEPAAFARSMDRIEKWTRVLCVIAGVVLGLLAIASFVGCFGVSVGIGQYGPYAAFVFGFLAAVCLARGLKGEGADLSIIERMPGFRRFRLR